MSAGAGAAARLLMESEGKETSLAAQHQTNCKAILKPTQSPCAIYHPRRTHHSKEQQRPYMPAINDTTYDKHRTVGSSSREGQSFVP